MLEKRFFATTVEAPEQVASRVTAAVQEHYTPAMEQARGARLQARRAHEMAQTSQATSKALKTAQEALKKLQDSSRQMLELLARGGPQLEVLRQQVGERLERERSAKQHRAEQQQERSRGRSR